jgi:hypothetical protein
MKWNYQLEKNKKMLITIADENLCLIPLHNNILANDRNSVWGKDFLEEDILSRLFGEINTKTSEIFLFDFSNINHTTPRIIHCFDLFLRSHQHVFFCGILSERIIRDFNNATIDNGQKLTFDEDHKLFYPQNADVNKLKRWSDNDLDYLYEKIKHFKGSKIIEFIEKTCPIMESGSLVYLESSNIYANRYIDVKKIFTDPILTRIIVYEMCGLLSDYVKEKKQNEQVFSSDVIALLGVSNNGAILANMIAKLLRLNFFSYKSLGPHYCDQENQVVERIRRNKKYILISDFICLGMEYKRSIAVFNAANSQIIGHISCMKYADVFREGTGDNNSIRAFIDLSKHRINYSISINL